VHRPFAHVDVGAHLQGEPEDLAVQSIDLVVLAGQVLGQPHVAASESLLCLRHL
jgi:hypothetical protein